MDERHEVISAFLDDEPFDARDLAAALDDPAGRNLFVDLIALRHLMLSGSTDAPTLMHRTPRRHALPAFVAAAAILVALVGGYLVSEQRRQASFAAPPATRIVSPSAPWQDVPRGRMR